MKFNHFTRGRGAFEPVIAFAVVLGSIIIEINKKKMGVRVKNPENFKETP
ncbi:MAG: hypothetical protein IKX40_06560 [Thermoguttaceae bacterium]|nr:hypothetical protein [Thermoguttaceae bacterium]